MRRQLRAERGAGDSPLPWAASPGGRRLARVIGLIPPSAPSPQAHPFQSHTPGMGATGRGWQDWGTSGCCRLLPKPWCGAGSRAQDSAGTPRAAPAPLAGVYAVGGTRTARLPLTPRPSCSHEPNPSLLVSARGGEADEVCYLLVPSPAKCKAGGWLSGGVGGSSTRDWSPAGSGLGVRAAWGQVLSSLPFSLYR